MAVNSTVYDRLHSPDAADGAGGNVETAATQPETALSRELSVGITRLRSLVETGSASEAEALLRQLEAAWPGDGTLRYFRGILAPPQIRVRRGERSRETRRENAWLISHSREYPGCWLAVKGDRLLAADPDLTVVHDAVSADPDPLHAVIYFQSPPDP